MESKLLELLKEHGVTKVVIDRDASLYGAQANRITVTVDGRQDVFHFAKINHMLTEHVAAVIASYIKNKGATQ